MNRRLIIISGLSGSGKSTAARALEDQGYFVVDNLPLVMLPDFMLRVASGLEQKTHVAVVIDVRNRGFLTDPEEIFQQLRGSNSQLEILFFEAADDVLQRRYSETRRAHPLAAGETVQAGIDRERQQLRQLRNLATRVMDSSHLNVRQLRSLIFDFIGNGQQPHLIVSLESFGYRYGLPPAADLVFDVRFLPNPHYLPELRPLSGLDEDLREYVLGQPASRDFRHYLDPLLSFLIPQYRDEGKSYLTIAIGCTGGRHRSVSLAEDLARSFPADQVVLRITHRDLERD